MDLHLICQGQFATLSVTPTMYSGSVGVHTLSAEFDEVWNDYEKVGVFYIDINDPYFAIMEENKCVIPHEVMDKRAKLNIGIMGRLGEKIFTSQIVRVDVGQGAVSQNLQPSDPTPELWQQLLQRYDYIVGKVDQSYKDQQLFFRETTDNLNDFKKSWDNHADQMLNDVSGAIQNVNDALSELQLSFTDMDGGDPFTDFENSEYIDANGGYPV